MPGSPLNDLRRRSRRDRARRVPTNTHGPEHFIVFFRVYIPRIKFLFSTDLKFLDFGLMNMELKFLVVGMDDLIAQLEERRPF